MTYGVIPEGLLRRTVTLTVEDVLAIQRFIDAVGISIESIADTRKRLDAVVAEAVQEQVWSP